MVGRRWPDALTFDDVQKVDKRCILEWISRAGEIEAIHLWGGFPCKDLSGAKARRENLDGQHSSLFYQMKRVWGDVQAAAPNLETLVFAENVCSMDCSARDRISEELGVWPHRVDSEPFCDWTFLRTLESKCSLMIVQT